MEDFQLTYLFKFVPWKLFQNNVFYVTNLLKTITCKVCLAFLSFLSLRCTDNTRFEDVTLKKGNKLCNVYMSIKFAACLLSIAGAKYFFRYYVFYQKYMTPQRKWSVNRFDLCIMFRC